MKMGMIEEEVDIDASPVVIEYIYRVFVDDVNG